MHGNVGVGYAGSRRDKLSARSTGDRVLHAK